MPVTAGRRLCYRGRYSAEPAKFGIAVLHSDDSLAHDNKTLQRANPGRLRG